MIKIFSRASYKFDRKNIKKEIKKFLLEKGLGNYHLNIIFVGKRKMRQLTEKYKKEKVALPVLAFPYFKDENVFEEPLLGEIFLCYPQVVLLSAEREKEVDKMIIDLIKHGINNLLSSSSN